MEKERKRNDKSRGRRESRMLRVREGKMGVGREKWSVREEKRNGWREGIGSEKRRK